MHFGMPTCSTRRDMCKGMDCYLFSLIITTLFTAKSFHNTVSSLGRSFLHWGLWFIMMPKMLTIKRRLKDAKTRRGM
jgi:hypothetical protein